MAATVFQRIERLDEEGYGEEGAVAFDLLGGSIRATHTFNQSEGMTVIDAVMRRRK